MGLSQLSKALRLGEKPRLALVGSGGKSTSLFTLAREYHSPVLLTATTHLSLDQIQSADQHFVLETTRDLAEIKDRIGSGVTLVTGPPAADRRTSGLEGELLEAVKDLADARGIPILVEADGSRQKPLKAPAEHEPPIPAWVDHVAVVAGLSALGKPLSQEIVHRMEIFSRVTGVQPGQEITIEAVQGLLRSPDGGLKNIPGPARRSVILNQADTPDLQSQAGEIAAGLLDSYASVIAASLRQGQIHAVYERIAGVVLAAGGSRRLGQAKQLLDWQGEPLVRRAARTALNAGLSPVVVVTGSGAAEVAQAVHDLPVCLVHNPDWSEGQSTSLRAGINSLAGQVGGAVFLLSDQPFASEELVRMLVDAHRQSLDAVIAPQVGERRTNPVLFDREAFPALAAITGDVGGRAIFDRFPVRLLPWQDSRLLFDIDTAEDYRKLVEYGKPDGS